MGTEHESVHHSNAGWTPIYAADNIAMISIGHMLESEDQAVIWRGPKKNGMIKQFLRDVAWDDLDYLLVDTPPGTSDEHISIVQLLKDSGIDGAIVITTPQVRKVMVRMGLIMKIVLYDTGGVLVMIMVVL